MRIKGILFWMGGLLTLIPVFGGDSLLDSAAFGEVSARCIGSATMSGRITDIDVPIGDESTVYVSTAGGGVWKSEDGGIQFLPIFDEHPQSVGCLSIAPSDAKILWVGTGEINVRNSVSIGNGVYKSTDAGRNWTHMGLSDSERIGAIAIHPLNPEIVYVAALGPLWGDGGQRGLYKTEDGGKTWNLVLECKVAKAALSTGCIDVEMDPQEPDTLYAALWQVRRQPFFFESGGLGSGMFKSTDGGKTWREMRTGLPEGELGRIDLDIAPSRPNRIYAMVESKKTALYRSDDGGGTWESVNSGNMIAMRPFYLSIVKADPKNHNRVYNPSLQLAVSEDGGKSFRTVLFGSTIHADMQAIWVNPARPNHLLLGTDGGVYQSFDGGGHFSFLGSLPVSQFYHVSVDDQVPYNVYGGLQDNGSWKAPSAAPGGIKMRDWLSLGGGDGFAVYADPADNNSIYWLSQGGNLMRLDLMTNEQKDIKPYPGAGMEKNRFNWNAALALSPNHPSRLYFGSQYLYRSNDRGDSWERLSGDLTSDDPQKQQQEKSGGLTPDATSAENHCTIFTIAESPLDDAVIWVGTDDGNLQLTRDGGKTWENLVSRVPDLPKAAWVRSVEPSSHQAASCYVVFDAHGFGDHSPYVYKTEDFGQTWMSLADPELTGYGHVIRQDPVNPALLFLGTEWGLFISIDDGDHWVRFTGNLPHKVAVRDLTIQKRENDLVVATHGRGIYILDDITPLRHLSPEILAEPVAMLPARPSRPNDQRYYQNYPGDGVFVGDNPPEGLTFTYYLKKRHIIGDMRVEIYDQEGSLIKTLPGGKRRGINRISWNMRLPAPKTSRGPGLLFGAMLGPTVPEGTYTVKLVKGKETYEAKVDLLPGLLNRHNAEDRELQRDITMALYRLQEDLAYFGDALGDLGKQIQKRKEVSGKGRLATALDQKANALSELRGLIQAEESSYAATHERLRDEVVDLYGSVSGYRGRPTESQINQRQILEDRVAQVRTRFELETQLDDLNDRLVKANQEPLKLLDPQAWRAGTESSAGGGRLLSPAALRYWLSTPLTGLSASR